MQEVYINEEHPDILRFMIPSRDDALADQMKPNLLCMLCTLCPCLFRFELSVLQARFEEG